MRSMLRLCFVEALRRAAGCGTPMWIEASWEYDYRSPWKA